MTSYSVTVEQFNHPDGLRDIAEALCGTPIVSLTSARSGGNNRVFRAETNCGVFALKAYPSARNDPRDRLGTEFAAFEFLTIKGEASVPRPVDLDRQAGYALYEWVDGAAISSPAVEQINQAVGFAERLRDLSNESGAQRLADASEACFSGSEIVRQIEGRLDRLQQADQNKPDLQTFINREFVPAFDRVREVSRTGYWNAGLRFDTDISIDQKTLSPSDFGFHNALARPDGFIVFIDFEYFGWDDPVRLVADFLLHPGMSLGKDGRRAFLASALGTFSGDAEFAVRLELLYPLIVLRWVMIILNEFLPGRWTRRKFAGAVGTLPNYQAQQLEKARRMLERVNVLTMDSLDGH